MITIKYYAEQKGCSRQTVYNQIKRGRVKAVTRYGRTLIYDNKNNRNWTPNEGNGRPKK